MRARVVALLLAAAWLFITVGPVAAAPEGPTSRAALVSLRPGYGAPGGLQLRWAAASSSWWSVGLDFNAPVSGLESTWLRRQWRLVPDVLAQVGLEAGWALEPGLGSSGSPGPWLGFYVGQQWQAGAVLAEVGTSLRLVTRGPHRALWETAALLGLTW